MIFAHVILASIRDCVSYFSFIVLVKHIQIMCFCFLFQFQFLFIFYFSFWVLCGSQCPIWNNSVWASYYSVWASTSSLWSSWIFGVLNLQSPFIFCFYVLVSVLNNQASNLQQSKTLSSSLFSTNRLNRYDSSSFNKYYSGFVHGFLSNDIIYGFQYEIGRWRQRSRW